MPPAHLLLKYKEDHDENAYEKNYRKEVLDKLDPAAVAKELDGKVLCCYEKSDNFCHRHLVAAWLRENGFECREIGKEDFS